MDYDQLISQLQDIAQTWEHILFLSGGKLNLSKCSWYVLSWEWKNGRPNLRQISPTDATISLRQGRQTQSTTIPRTDPKDSTRMLGIHMNPMGDFTYHLKQLRQKANSYATRLMSPRLTAEHIRIFYRSIYMIPSMRYSLPALAVDKETLPQVQSRVVQVMLQQMNVSSTVPTSICHGPLELGGLGINDLSTEAGLEALKLFRNAIYSNSEVGNMIRLNLQYSQLESGIGEALLEHPSIYIQYLTPSWILSLRQYLSCHNMTVTISEPFIVPLQSGNDQYIMQQEHLMRYTPSQQRDINLVRIYLQVTTLSEMSDPERHNTIDLKYLDGRRPNNWVKDPRWPRQETPSPSQRRLWKRYIPSTYLR